MIGRPRARNLWRVNLLNLLVLLLILAPASAGLLYGYHLFTAVQQTHRYEIPEGPVGIVKVLQNLGISFHGHDAMNVMVLGIDYNWTDSTHLPYSAGARSDTMFVLHLVKDGSRLGMLTIPRDMYIEQWDSKGHLIHDKINGAYSDGGWKLAQKTLSKFLGIHIDHHVVLRIEGTARLIDALGGLDINVEHDMSYDDNWGLLHVHLKKGFQHLNGLQAVGYARFRHDAESDFGRIRRQQQVVDTLIKKLKQPQNFADPRKLQKIAQLFHKYVETDLKVPEMLDLARVYQNFDRQNFATGYIPGNDGWVGDMSVLYPPDRTVIRKMVRKVLMANEAFGPGDLSVEVLNGSDVPGAATSLADALTKRGYNVVRSADYVGDHPPNSVVVLHTTNPGQEKVAASLVPGLPVMHEADYPLATSQDTAKDTMVTIILATDWSALQTLTPTSSGLPVDCPPHATITVLPPPRDTSTTSASGSP